MRADVSHGPCPHRPRVRIRRGSKHGTELVGSSFDGVDKLILVGFDHRHADHLAGSSTHSRFEERRSLAADTRGCGASVVLVSCHSDGSWPGPGTTFTWWAGTGSWHWWQVSPARRSPPHTVCCATRGGPSDPARCWSPHCMRASSGTNS